MTPNSDAMTTDQTADALDRERIAAIRERIDAYHNGGWGKSTDPYSVAWSGFVPVAAALYANAPQDLRFLIDLLSSQAARLEAQQVQIQELQKELARGGSPDAVGRPRTAASHDDGRTGSGS